MESQNFEQWKKVEENVNEAEKNKRQAQKASQMMYRETKIPKEERQEKSEEEILEKSKRGRVAKKALERENVFETEAEKILGEENSPERELVELRKENLIKALRYEKAIQMERKGLLLEKVEILKGFDGAPSGEELEALDEVRDELGENQNLREKSLELSPESYFGLHLKQLEEYKKELEDGKIVETDYVKEQMEDIEVHLQANKPILIYGHLGSGKSELAMHTAKKYISENNPDILEKKQELEDILIKQKKEKKYDDGSLNNLIAVKELELQKLCELKGSALIISGSKNISQAEFYGHQVLTVDEKTGSTVSDFFMGPIYQAMEEGRIIIIDEVNAIPHEVLISLNHILTRKVGDKINIQQDSGREIEIKEGFGIMMTGNLNQGQEKYVDRQDMDPAFLSRLHKIEYDYLPQETEGSLEDSAGKENELFHLILADIMDKNGNMEIPKGSEQKLWNLAKSARLIQNVFAGKEIDGAYYFKEAGGRSTKYFLQENVLSIRALENVISQWKMEGYEKELDYYIWNNFIKESTVATDRAYLYQILKDQFGFFQSDGWDKNLDYGNEGVVNSFEISAPKNKSAKREFFGPRETVEMAFGKAPERTKWPEVSSAVEMEEENIINPEIMEMEEWNGFLKKEMGDLKNEIKEVCVAEQT
ncbi:MAG: AAA family ATPase [bacterium]|nr:AAA family ATPase [bacterium]